jgi:hypothetical protein
LNRETAAAERVTATDPVVTGGPALCPLIVTGLAGVVVGAEYKPLVEIVPSAVLPPVTPFTIHVTAWLVVPVTTAEYWPVCPKTTLAGPLTATEIGTTVTLMEPVVVLDKTLTAVIVTTEEGAVDGGV